MGLWFPESSESRADAVRKSWGSGAQGENDERGNTGCGEGRSKKETGLLVTEDSVGGGEEEGTKW